MITLTVSPSPEQTFQGAGFSIVRLGNPYESGRVKNDAFNRAAFADLNAKILRLWHGYDLNAFVRRYVDSGALEAARHHGVDTLLLAPIAFNEIAVEVPDDWESGNAVTPTGIKEHPKLVARQIRELRDKHGVVINATGIMNEPGSGHRTNVPRDLWLGYAHNMRDALEAEGLRDVTLVGLEWQPPSSTSTDYIRRMGEHVAPLDGVSTHSYHLPIQAEDADLAAKHRFAYWQTEAGGFRSAANAAARMLSDLNHFCGVWVAFIGPHTGVSMHSLLAPDGDGIQFADHYWSLKLLWNAFVPGTVIHRVDSSATGRMRDDFGRNPVVAAAGVRPDGRWVIGIANSSGGPRDRWFKFLPAEAQTVRIEMPVGEDVDFEVATLRIDGSLMDSPPIVAGVNIGLTVRAGEVATLTQVKGTPPPPPPPPPDDHNKEAIRLLNSAIDDLREARELLEGSQ